MIRVAEKMQAKRFGDILCLGLLFLGTCCYVVADTQIEGAEEHENAREVLNVEVANTEKGPKETIFLEELMEPCSSLSKNNPDQPCAATTGSRNLIIIDPDEYGDPTHNVEPPETNGHNP